LAFIFISVTVLLKQLASGQLVVLQLEKMRLLAKANFYGNLMGLFQFSILLLQNRCDNTDNDYYFIKLIFVCILFFKKNRNSKKITIKELLLEGKGIVQLCFTNNKRIIDFAVYLFNSNYVGKIGGLEEVGFYTLGFTLLLNHFYCNEYGLFSEIVFYSDDNVKERVLFSNRSFQFDYNANSNPVLTFI
jgi:hypothetical protein